MLADRILSPDRFFDPDPSVRRFARRIYEQTSSLPLICPHGHVDPALLATNEPFPEPTALLITPDHYIFRMLYSQGISMESLGIPTIDGSPVEQNPRTIWQRFASHYHLFLGTPTGCWMEHELVEVFGVNTPITESTAMRVYDELAEKLTSPEFRPRALFDRFNIEALATTDAATDTLQHHQAIRTSGWNGTVVPTFRPDALFRIANPKWRAELTRLESQTGRSVNSMSALINAIEMRRAFFVSLGATATDHAVVEPYTQRLSDADANVLFERALQGNATVGDQRRFEAHLLIEMARMSANDGLVMQLHAGASRDHNTSIRKKFGADKGADIPVATEWTTNLHALLNAHGNDPRLTLILFTLDESTYARELAPLAGHYPALRLGPPWWFHDSINGMVRFRDQVHETAGLWNTVGFNDDTRAFCSIPARHDLNRRVDANWLAGLVARHIISIDDAHVMARACAYELVRQTYRFDRLATNHGASANGSNGRTPDSSRAVPSVPVTT
ncbi:MAG: glucuronate isomerase [Gemmatimonas sp.]